MKRETFFRYKGRKPATGALVTISLLCSAGVLAESGRPEPALPIFKDGEAQVVDRFKDPDMWIRHDL
ncbi:MAG: hypothetical protein EBU26_11990, partial [Verrucomicrobia bacterium]|nr:hypothetical protein [Verrucomicrobiota bacterium]